MRTSPKIFILATIAAFLFNSCAEDPNAGWKNPTGIPSDSQAGPTPEVIAEDANAVIPNANFSPAGKHNVMNLNLTGIANPVTKEWMRLFGTGNAKQNVWLEVDGKAKGIVVENLADQQVDGTKAEMWADLVFLIDNSGSMNQESDAVARDVAAWAQNLAASGLSIRFACVGYGHLGVNGGIDFTDADGITAFLNRPGKTQTQRTVGFEGYNAAELSAAAAGDDSYYTNVNAECGVRALRFADENFIDYRDGANRIYVNFTDEFNQPFSNVGGVLVKNEFVSVEFVSNPRYWGTNQGTIHTVYSGEAGNDAPTAPETALQTGLGYREWPWRLSEYTGGTHMFAPASFAGVNLDGLPVTGALQNSISIKFRHIPTRAGETHNVKLTVVSEDGSVKAVKEFTDVVF